MAALESFQAFYVQSVHLLRRHEHRAPPEVSQRPLAIVSTRITSDLHRRLGDAVSQYFRGVAAIVENLDSTETLLSF